MAGFIVAFLIVMGVGKEEADKVRCPVCRNIYPAETEVCSWCGTPMSMQNLNPLATHCLRAVSYARTSLGGICWLAVLVTAGYLIFTGALALPKAFPAELGPWRPLLIGVAAVVAFLIGAYCLEFLFSAIAQTVTRRDEGPKAPAFFDLTYVAAGFKGVAALVVYVLPILTIPLLPMGLLWLGTGGKAGAFHPGRAVRSVWRDTKGFAIIWLLLLLWAAMLTLAVTLTMVVRSALMDLMPSVGQPTDTVLSVVTSAIGVAVIAAAGGIFALAMFRCIGILGRYRPGAASAAGRPVGD